MKRLELFVLVAILGLAMPLILAPACIMINTANAQPLIGKYAPLAAADLNNDGNVTLLDLTAFGLVYGLNSSSPNWNSEIASGYKNVNAADFLHKGVIGLPDLVTLAFAYWYNSTTTD